VNQQFFDAEVFKAANAPEEQLCLEALPSNHLGIQWYTARKLRWPWNIHPCFYWTKHLQMVLVVVRPLAG